MRCRILAGSTYYGSTHHGSTHYGDLHELQDLGRLAQSEERQAHLWGVVGRRREKETTRGEVGWQPG